MAELFEVVTLDQARKMLLAHFRPPLAEEEISLQESLDRQLARDVIAVEEVPGFPRASMDGLAVRARDTFGASESQPAYLEITGEVTMGREPQGEVTGGQAWRIATGGMLPPGADAVVMVEYTEELDDRTAAITRPAAPGENVIRRGEDMAPGNLLLGRGHRVRPQDLGLMAAAGINRVPVLAPLPTAILSTGDELLPPGEVPRPGQVRDVNSCTLYGAVTAAGGKPALYGIVPDEPGALQRILARALEENHLVLVSGGSSVGARDLTAGAVASLGKPGMLFHGLAVKPGKPTVGAAVDGKLVLGLPGHPVSALVVFELLASPLLRYGDYLPRELEFPLKARLTRNLRSAPGREDVVPVRLFPREGELAAEPVWGKSGLISITAAAQGLAYVPPEKEGLEAGQVVAVRPF